MEETFHRLAGDSLIWSSTKLNGRRDQSNGANGLMEYMQVQDFNAEISCPCNLLCNMYFAGNG